MTSPDFPRSPLPNQAERVHIGLRRAGTTSRYSRPVGNKMPRSVTGGGNVEFVYHGADPTVERPAADWVVWVGAATPDNGFATDGWYTDNVDPFA